MRYVAAYLLAVIGGNKTPNGGDLEKILSSVGIEAEKDKLDKVIKELNGKDLKQLLEQGKHKLSSMPSGGAVAAASSAAAAPAAGGADKKESKKEEKKPEPEKEESDEDMGFGLFD